MKRWTLPERVSFAIVPLLVFTVWGMANCKMIRLGCDGIQFYAAGTIVNRGEAGRLYDPAYFHEVEHPLGESTMREEEYPTHLYPPTVAMFAAPWARLPFRVAMIVWWIVQGLLFAAAGAMVLFATGLPREWRWPTMLALVAVFPVWMSLRVAQLSPLWLVALLAGTILHHRGRLVLAGLAFSLLALKPPLAVPVFAWLVMRTDWRALRGMLGGVAVQVAAVIVFLGPGIPWYYVQAMPYVAKAAKAPEFSATYEHSFAGNLKNLLINNHWMAKENAWLPMLAQPLLMALAGVMLWQVIRLRKRRLADGTAQPWEPRYEYAAMSLFLVLSTPHLLLYDASLLVVPIAWLWASPGWRGGNVLWFAATVLGACVNLLIGTSMTPLLALLILHRLAKDLSGMEVMEATGKLASPPVCREQYPSQELSKVMT